MDASLGAGISTTKLRSRTVLAAPYPLSSMRSLLGAGTATFVIALLVSLYASGPSQKASSKRCPATNPTAAAAFCFADSNGHIRLARRTNAWERFKGAVTGTP